MSMVDKEMDSVFGIDSKSRYKREMRKHDDLLWSICKERLIGIGIFLAVMLIGCLVHKHCR